MDVNALSFMDLSYAIGHTPILSALSGGIRRGSLTGLIGPNGAGKSTLLRLLSGLRKPSAGEVTLNGHPVHALPDKFRAQQIAMMPQNPSIGFGFTVHEVVAMGRHPFLHRLSPLSEKCHQVISEAMRVTEIERFADRRITELSGGEQQRVFLARALAQEPSILLLDEPTANLDIRHQLEVFELIVRLQKERAMTVVMAVHDLTSALRYCTHLIVLHEGRLVAQGPTEDIVTEQLIRDVFGVKATIERDASRMRVDVVSL